MTGEERLTPSGWEFLTVGEAHSPITNFEKVKAKDYLIEGQFPVIDQGAKFIGGYTNDDDKLINHERSVVVFGDHTRILKYVDFPFVAGADGTKIMQPAGYFNAKTFFYFLKAVELPDRGYGRHFQYLRESEIPLPPLAEQVRIADKLDALLARVEAGRERLERVPKLLNRFRQSVLSAAVSGELTREWRGDVDAEWEASTLSQCGLVSGGLTKNSKRHELPLKRPYLRVANVQTNRLELSDVGEIGLTQQEWDKTALKANDLLIVEGNGSLEHLGRVSIWSGEVENCSHQNHLIRWRSTSQNARYVLYFLLSPEGRDLIVNIASTTTGLYTLSISKVSAIPIQLPPLPEQAEIVRRVESLFAIADRIEAKYAAALSSFDRLTPALLAKAFRGELVPQDPNDEPASVLLERIQVQRAEEGGAAKRVRKPRPIMEVGEGDEPKHRGRRPKAESESITVGEPKRRGRPPKVREKASVIPQASSLEEAVRLLQERGQQRAEGGRQVSLFDEEIRDIAISGRTAVLKTQTGRKLSENAPVQSLEQLVELLQEMGGTATPEQLIIASNLQGLDSIEHFFDLLRDGRNTQRISVQSYKDGSIISEVKE